MAFLQVRFVIGEALLCLKQVRDWFIGCSVCLSYLLFPSFFLSAHYDCNIVNWAVNSPIKQTNLS